LNAWIASRPRALKPSRPEAIRRLLRKALKAERPEPTTARRVEEPEPRPVAALSSRNPS
jgi:hypothetical protein